MADERTYYIKTMSGEVLKIEKMKLSLENLPIGEGLGDCEDIKRLKSEINKKYGYPIGSQTILFNGYNFVMGLFSKGVKGLEGGIELSEGIEEVERSRPISNDWYKKMEEELDNLFQKCDAEEEKMDYEAKAGQKYKSYEAYSKAKGLIQKSENIRESDLSEVLDSKYNLEVLSDVDEYINTLLTDLGVL
jgi:hypothetical protein